jgi:hypothetical protein
MKNSIILKKVNDSLYEVYFQSSTYLGQFIMEVDGDFYYWPSKKSGCWSAWSLRLISDKLTELNSQSSKHDSDESGMDDWEHGTFI